MSDVLPGSARASRSARALVLPAVLLGELLVGLALGVARPWAGGGSSAVPPGVSEASSGTLRTPPPAPPSSPPAPQVTHTPVNPFSPR